MKAIAKMMLMTRPAVASTLRQAGCAPLNRAPAFVTVHCRPGTSATSPNAAAALPHIRGRFYCQATGDGSTDCTEASPGNPPAPTTDADYMFANPMSDHMREDQDAEQQGGAVRVPDLQSTVAPPGAEDMGAGQSLEGDMSVAEALQQAMRAANEPIKKQGANTSGAASGYAGGDEAEGVAGLHQGGPGSEGVKETVREEALRNDDVLPSNPS